MSAAASLTDARQRLHALERNLDVLDGRVPHADEDRDELYRSALVVAATVVAELVAARTTEGARRLRAALAPTVYLAAAFRRQDEMRQHAALLGAYGYRVTARWLTALEDAPDDLDGQRTAAIQCLEDVAAADVVIAFSEPRGSGYWTGGRHVELGYALALGKRVFLLGPHENVFHAAPSVERVASLVDVLDALVPASVAMGAVS